MQVLWNERAERTLHTLPPAHADRIIDAVVDLAETGRGFVRRTFDPPEQHLYIQGYVVTFEIDRNVMFVLSVRRSARRR